jgi:hypothetical protein
MFSIVAGEYRCMQCCHLCTLTVSETFLYVCRHVPLLHERGKKFTEEKPYPVVSDLLGTR